jgi:hypothetical protein
VSEIKPLAEDAKVSTQVEFTESGDVSVTKTQDIQAILDDAAAHRAESDESGFKLSSGSNMTYVGTIPAVIVAQWQNEGFYLSSPERSGMTKEEHQFQVLKRLQGMTALLTSKYKRLV